MRTFIENLMRVKKYTGYKLLLNFCVFYLLICHQNLTTDLLLQSLLQFLDSLYYYFEQIILGSSML